MPTEQIARLKKKQWYPIIAPKLFNEVVLGETLVSSPKAMLGKTLSHSLMNLINDVKRQNIHIHFKVVEVEGDKGRTSVTGYQIAPSSVKRFVRRNSEKMDLSFTCETADNTLLRVKPLVIAKADVKGSVAAKLRNMIAQLLVKTIKKMTYEQVMNDLISHKFQAMMRENLNKVYPLKVCEMRYLGIELRESPEAKEEVKVEAQEQK